MGQSKSSTTSKSNASLTKTQTLFLSLSKSLSAFELQDYDSIFLSLAETEGANTFWSEDTFVRFLDVPPKIGSLLFKSASYLASLPNVENAPVPLNREGLGIAVLILTQHVPADVFTKQEIHRLIFNSFADVPQQEESIDTSEKLSKARYAPKVPIPKMTQLILFLLESATFQAPSTLESSHSSTTNQHQAALIAKSMLSAIQSYANSQSESIHYDSLRAFVEYDAPFFFDPIIPLFQKFLYDKEKWGDNPKFREDWTGTLQAEKTTELMSESTLAQISTFLPKERRLGKLTSLYIGSNDGFSMGMFESKVLKYPG